MGRLRPSKRTFTARGSTSPLGDTHMRPLPSSCPPLRGSACTSAVLDFQRQLWKTRQAESPEDGARSHMRAMTAKVYRQHLHEYLCS